jgi:2-amino-4-hydroxy-6-hydroxymethyldihydropteridine diphosphokinase
MNLVYIALGSNLGDRHAHLKLALKYLNKILNDVVVSKVYESVPMYNHNQPYFLNQVLKAYTSLAPLELLRATQGIQKILGRLASLKKNQPRVIDIDLLDYQNIVLQTKPLTLPHPLIHERLFVLEPMAQIDSHWTIKGKTAQDWMFEMSDSLSSPKKQQNR